ncbi:MAG TPA: hypothetical protein PLB78_01495, partial [Anaerolineae bacterium]|nr:hypothetical protein [Anaerolineae bacterium]
KGHLSLDDVRALKAFCRVHAVTPQEHEATAQGVGVDRRELVDENNQHFADWLLAQRRSLPRGGGGLRFAMPAGPAPWKLRLPEQPPAWQAALAWLAALVALASTIAAVAL